MSERSVASRPRGSSRKALRIKRSVAALIVLVAAAIGIDYGAAAITESVVAREMRTQLALADDPSVRINNFPFLTQAISGKYRSIDVVADHMAVGPLRDVQVRSQLRDVAAPLSQMLGGPAHRDGPRGRGHRADRRTGRRAAHQQQQRHRGRQGLRRQDRRRRPGEGGRRTARTPRC